MPKIDYDNDADFEAHREHTFDPSRRIAVDRPIGGPKSTLAVRLDGADIERLRDTAQKAGIGITQLVRTWVLERLDALEAGAEDPLLKDLLVTLEHGLDTARRVRAAHLNPSAPAA